MTFSELVDPIPGSESRLDLPRVPLKSVWKQSRLHETRSGSRAHVEWCLLDGLSDRPFAGPTAGGSPLVSTTVLNTWWYWLSWAVLSRKTEYMWIPRSGQELLDGLPGARETAYLEFKRELPDRSKNIDIAVDVSAMGIDGGVVIYGVAEDRDTQTFVANPIELAGQSERIDQVLRTYTGGQLRFSISALPDPDPLNTGKGYIVVHVPASPLAPHMVEGRGMYGRGDKGIRLLTQGDVDRLYERRAEWGVSAEEQLAAARELSDLRAGTQASPAVMRMVVKPLTGNTLIREQAGLGTSGSDIIQLGIGVMNLIQFVRHAPYEFSSIGRTYTMGTAQGLRLVAASAEPGDLVEFEVQDDGTVIFAHGHIMNLTVEPGSRVVIDSSVAQMTAHVLATAGEMYRRAGFFGVIDVALVIEGATGAVSYDWYVRGVSSPFARTRGVLRGAEVVSSVRTTTDELLELKAVEVARQLFGPIGRSVRNPGWPDPLELG